MSKKIKDKNKSIFIKFKQEVSEQEVLKLFNSLNLESFRASNLINRWVVEVPFWKEDYYIEKFSSNSDVEKVYESFNKKTFFYKEEQYETEEEVETNE